jgi:L-asparaginase/Glu-tRNA(Gln) amidotransferase subunit D
MRVVPELRTFANLQVKVLMNKDSCQIGPQEWINIAKVRWCKSKTQNPC